MNEYTTINLQDYSFEIYNRILNNLLYINKSKGTLKSIRALLACYGIPESVLQISEHALNQDNEQEHVLTNNINYLRFSGNEYVMVPFETDTRTVEFNCDIHSAPESKMIICSLQNKPLLSSYDINVTPNIMAVNDVGLSSTLDAGNSKQVQIFVGSDYDGISAEFGNNNYIELKLRSYDGYLTLFFSDDNVHWNPAPPDYYTGPGALYATNYYSRNDLSLTETILRYTPRLDGSRTYYRLNIHPATTTGGNFYEKTYQVMDTPVDQLVLSVNNCNNDLYNFKLNIGSVDVGETSPVPFEYIKNSHITILFDEDNPTWKLDVKSNTEGIINNFQCEVVDSLLEGCDFFDRTVLLLGRDSTNLHSFNGGISQVRLWNDTLVEAELLSHTIFKESLFRNQVENIPNSLKTYVSFNTPHAHMIAENSSSFFSANESFNEKQVNIFLYGTQTGFVNYPYAYFDETYEATVHLSSINSSISTLLKTYTINNSSLERIKLQRDSSVLNDFYKTLSIPINRVDINFSYTAILNEYIMKIFGISYTDSLFADPSDIYKESFSEADEMCIIYNNNFRYGMSIGNFISYIKNFDSGIFEHIKDLLPLKVKAMLGFVIEPTILEATKYKHNKPIAKSDSLRLSVGNSQTIVGSKKAEKVSIPINTSTISSKKNTEASFIYKSPSAISGQSKTALIQMQHNNLINSIILKFDYIYNKDEDIFSGTNEVFLPAFKSYGEKYFNGLINTYTGLFYDDYLFHNNMIFAGTLNEDSDAVQRMVVDNFSTQQF